MPILDEILGFFRKPRPAGSNVPTQHVESVLKLVRSDSTNPGKQQVKIIVTLDLTKIQDTRHIGPAGYFGYSWNENAGIGVMNNLVAAGIPMDWRHFISWSGDRLNYGAYKPTRGTLVFDEDPDFAMRSRVRVTWLDA